MTFQLEFTGLCGNPSAVFPLHIYVMLKTNNKATPELVGFSMQEVASYVRQPASAHASVQRVSCCIELLRGSVLSTRHACLPLRSSSVVLLFVVVVIARHGWSFTSLSTIQRQPTNSHDVEMAGATSFVALSLLSGFEAQPLDLD